MTNAILDFLQKGGPVMIPLTVVGLVMWVIAFQLAKEGVGHLQALLN